MEQEFGNYGAVTDAYNTGKGYAFITMGSPDEAQAAINKLHGAKVFGQTLKVDLAKPGRRTRWGLWRRRKEWRWWRLRRRRWWIWRRRRTLLIIKTFVTLPIIFVSTGSLYWGRQKLVLSILASSIFNYSISQVCGYVD